MIAPTVDPTTPLSGKIVLAGMLLRHKRIAIIGGPKTGKTTLSLYAGDRPVHHTDATIGSVPFGEQGDLWRDRLEGEERYIVEGVVAARALRAGLEVDGVILLGKPYTALRKGQAAMTKGVFTVVRQWLAKQRQPGPELVVPTP